jgi:hypothetical protein
MRTWLLAAVSTNLLRPPVLTPRLTIAKSTCPGGSVSKEVDNQIWNQLRLSLKFSSNTMIASMA